MIGPGWLPVPRARARRLRTLAYTRVRIPARAIAPKPTLPAAPGPVPVNTRSMLFDQPRDLPVATLRQAAPTALARLARDLRGWWAQRYAWLLPRRVPVLVAFLGMLATVQAVDYLANPPAPRMVDATEAGRVMFKGGQPYRDGKPLGDLPTSTYRVRLVVGQ